jgi:hypothetical protein
MSRIVGRPSGGLVASGAAEPGWRGPRPATCRCPARLAVAPDFHGDASPGDGGSGGSGSPGGERDRAALVRSALAGRPVTGGWRLVVDCACGAGSVGQDGPGRGEPGHGQAPQGAVTGQAQIQPDVREHDRRNAGQVGQHRRFG